MEEKWGNIQGTDGCMVSTLGRVKDKKGKIKSQDTDPEGYKRVSLKVNGKWSRQLPRT